MLGYQANSIVSSVPYAPMSLKLPFDDFLRGVTPKRHLEVGQSASGVHLPMASTREADVVLPLSLERGDFSIWNIVFKQNRGLKR